MSLYKVGTGSVCQVAKQTGGSYEGWDQIASPDTLVNMTSESIATSVTKGDEGNLLASKTKNQADLMSITVDGSVSTVLRPEFASWLLECGMGVKSNVSKSTATPPIYSATYTLNGVNNDLPVSTVVLSRGGIVKTYPNVTIKSTKISATAQDYVKVDIDVTGYKELEPTGTQGQPGYVPGIDSSLSSFSLPSYRCTQASLMYGTAGGTAATSLDVESCNITIDNGIQDAPITYTSGYYKNRPLIGLRAVTCDFSIPYSTALDTFRKTYLLAEESPNVALKLEFTTSDAAEKISIYLPNVNITSGTGNVGGAGVIDTSFSGEALSVSTTEPITVSIYSKQNIVGYVEPEE